jgi:hypothetical protein
VNDGNITDTTRYDRRRDHVAARHGVEDIERHGLVLGLLGRVPAPQLGVRAVHAIQKVLVAQQHLGQQRREVLERRGGGQPRRRGHALLQQRVALASPPR